MKQNQQNHEAPISPERMDRYTWKDEDLKVYSSVDDLKAQTEKAGGVYIDYTKGNSDK